MKSKPDLKIIVRNRKEENDVLQTTKNLLLYYYSVARNYPVPILSISFA